MTAVYLTPQTHHMTAVYLTPQTHHMTAVYLTPQALNNFNFYYFIIIHSCPIIFYIIIQN